MGTLITGGSIKSLLTIKAKSRHDNTTDQFHRIFMVKMCMVASLLLGLNWLKDTITCIIPGTSGGISKDYVHQACWIQGFYVYKELKHIPNMFGYYGIPKDLDDDGMYPATGQLCSVNDKNSQCIAMTKTFYLQYQWFPFYMATIALLYYLPYLFFRYVNTDIISLKASIKSDDVNVDEIIQNYFNHGINPVSRMRMRLFANLFVKLFYILVNIIAFTGTDSLINGEFKAYGNEWLKWGKQPNNLEFDYTASRKDYKPAERLLPLFGLCEVLELGKDIKHTLFNNHRFVCEISQNVLYQYVLVLLWFLFVMGMIVSCIGFLMLAGDHLLTVTSFVAQGDQTRKVYEALTLRECQYLEYIRKKDMAVYGKLVRKLKEERFHMDVNGYAPNAMPNNPYKDSQKLLHETLNLA